MSTVFDVTAITVDGGAAIALGSTVETVTIANVTDTPTVTISSPDAVDAVMVEVPGIQGPPGLKNVFVQPTDPSIGNNWGAGQTNFIWIQT